MFAFPWEISAYYDFTTRSALDTSYRMLLVFSEELGQRPVGCPGLDTPFEEWPLRNYNSPIWHSRAMSCGKQTYHDLATIVERWDQVTNIMSVIMILCQVRL